MAAHMNIAFFGSSLVSAYWNGAATYYRGLIRCLHERGHRITFYEPDAYQRQRHRDIADPPWAKVVVYPGDSEAEALSALERAKADDVIVKASGIGVYDRLLERAISELSSPRRSVIFWDVDAPATLERTAKDPRDPFREAIPKFDLILTYGGGEPVKQAYRALGAKSCIPVYNALDPTTHHPAVPETRFRGDLSFLGNRLPDRETRVAELFFRAAELMPEKTFVLGGSGWEPHALPRNVRWLGHVYTRDHNAFNASAEAVLNVTRDSMVRFGWSPATRVFEAAGAGACLITDAWDGVELFLEPDREVLVARDGAEVAEHLLRLTPERARRIGAAAKRRVSAEHTYAHRACQVEQILSPA
jgi:spore maturation protein CgeB